MSPAKLPQIVTQDEGSSDDHFSSASEGGSDPKSPIPITRVERVDDKPAHGEVPGTPAYSKRTWDAVPDEIEVIPEGQRSRSGTRSRAMSNLSLADRTRSSGSPVPRTVVERVDSSPAHGEVDGTAAKELRQADAQPDEIKRIDDSNGSHTEATMSENDTQTFFKDMWEGRTKAAEDEEPDQAQEEEEGDDFDDFAEENADDDFGDFDEADDTPMEPPEPPAQSEVVDVLAGLPKLDFSSDEKRQETITSYLDAIFEDDFTPKEASERQIPPPSAFLSDRSLSLWQQLVSPPPMQPQNWTRSRIRRLFLVSLGVPVDLDEILPPSKQKRLVLPNINLTTSPRESSVIERLRDSAVNDSTTSIDSKTGAPKPQKQKRVPKGPPPPPEFDLNAAVLLCGTTEEALSGYEDPELTEHVDILESLNKKASTVLEYWLVRKDESLKEKEALEGVIENLVGFVKGRRGK